MFDLDNIDNKLVLIGGLVLITVLCLILGADTIGEGFKDIALTCSGGLIGYLSKDNITRNTINHAEPPYEEDDDEDDDV